ncbi:MAG: lactoylglutathione lyase [Planctomycetota bacterium]|jgi:lactoylglutathione lyase
MKPYHTMIRVKDMDASIEFYTSFIGLKVTRRSTIGDEATLAFLSDESGHYSIELTYNHDGRDYELGNQFGHLAFLVDDLDAVKADVAKRGWWTRESKPEAGSQYIFVHDPSGYDIEILQARQN